MQLTVPPTVAQDFARTKSLLGRNETIRALEAFTSGLNTFEAAHVLGRARAGVEFTIQECVAVCNNHKDIRNLLQRLSKSDKAAIAYKPGEEAQLVSVLGIIRKALVEAEGAEQRAVEEEVRQYKVSQLAAAHQALQSGEAAKGRALLRRLGEDHSNDQSVLFRIADMLIQAGFMPDAVPYLEQSVADFPRESNAYGVLATCYMTLQEYEKAETLYKAAIKDFGAHPKTMANLGKLYIQWNKKEKAFEVLQQVVRREPDNAEVAELFAKVAR